MTATAALLPPAFMPSDYGPALRPHVSEQMDSFVSLPVRDLFPSFAPAITDGDEADRDKVRAETRAALAKVDMSRISADDTVNILASEHGFGLMGGWPYAEMIKTIREVVLKRTPCRRINLRLAIYRGFREADEVNAHFGFEEDHDRETRGLLAFFDHLEDGVIGNGQADSGADGFAGFVED